VRELGFDPSEHFSPSTPDEVCSLLVQYGKHARIIAGGTAIYELAKRGLADEVKQLISLRKMPLKYVRRDTEGLRIGATTTLAEMMKAPEILNDTSLRVVSEALREIRPNQVRNVATIGGEICTSLPLLDLPPALLAADAILMVQGTSGLRRVPLSEFLVDFFLNALKVGEFLLEALIPNQPPHSGSAFMKFGRTAYDFNLVNVATRLSLAPDNTCDDVRIYLGGIGRVPMHATASESELRGREVNDEALRKASEALGEFKAIPQIHGDAEYKRDIARVLIRNCVKRAMEVANS
jgi:carbon-monoxide dehydrogenase medium subunit